MKKKSTYALLINSAAEEKGRSIFEGSIFALVVLCIAVSGSTFASTSFVLPGVKKTDVQESVVAVANTHLAQSAVIASRG